MPNATRHDLSLTNITVQRGPHRVLDDINVKLSSGEIIAIVGPNGAGKTTLLETVLGVVRIAHWELHIDGRPLRTFAERARCFAHVAAEAEPVLEMAVDRFVELVQAASDASWSAFLEKRLGIDALRGATAARLSRGERRRLLLFETLSADKPLMLLDEPTGVFDPLQLLEIVEVFHAAAERGTGMLLTLHQMSDAEALATRVLILSQGRQVALGTMTELRVLAGLDPRSSLQEVFLKLLRTRKDGQLVGA